MQRDNYHLRINRLTERTPRLDRLPKAQPAAADLKIELGYPHIPLVLIHLVALPCPDLFSFSIPLYSLTILNRFLGPMS